LDVDRDGRVSEEDFVTFLGVVNPVEYELRIEALRQESLKLKGEAASVMMETDADAGRRAKALLKQQRKVEEQILDQEKQLVRHQRRDRQRVAGYNAIRAQLDQFEERREELQERVREGLLSDEMCEDLATLNRRVSEYKVLLADANKELEKVVDKTLITKTKAAEVAEAAANSPTISPQQLRRRGGITPDMAAVATQAYDAMPQLKLETALAVGFLKRQEGAQFARAQRGEEVSNIPGSARATQRESRRQTILRFLANVPVLRGLSGGDRVAIAKALKLKEYTAGRAIITEGEEGDTMYLIEEGTVQVEVRGLGKVGTIHEGGVFGDLALTTDQPRKATIRAVTDVTLLRLDRATFEHLVRGLAQRRARAHPSVISHTTVPHAGRQARPEYGGAPPAVPRRRLHLRQARLLQAFSAL
jgi:hypothetical protein